MIINQTVTDYIKSSIQKALVENYVNKKQKKWKKAIKYTPSSNKRKQ